MARGERSEENGYKKAAVIAQDKGLEDDLGGGVCQSSTTLYNAMLKARIPQPMGGIQRLFGGEYRRALGAGNAQAFQQGVKFLAVFGRVNVGERRAQDGDPRLHHRFGQFNSGLAAELYHDAAGYPGY